VGQLEGRLSGKIKEARKELMGLLAHIEATVDYPEYDIEEITGRLINEALKKIREKLERIAESFEKGRIIREGLNAVIIGKPNVGKSSLLNELAGKNRAIVTDVPGTTRDIIEEYVDIDGIPVKIADTAGIRETSDAVERIGVERAEKAIEDADLVIMMVDVREGIKEEDEKILEKIRDKKHIVVINKIDLSQDAHEYPILEGRRAIRTSVKYDIGIDSLEKEIKELFLKGEIGANNEVLVTNIRHKNLIDKAIESIDDACRAYADNMPVDIVSVDIKNAAEYLGRITGESVCEDLVKEIFEKFCIGK